LCDEALLRADSLERSLAFLAGRTFRLIRGSYRDGITGAKKATADAAVWISIALSDPKLATHSERWTSQSFGGLSDIYSRAMDGDFVNGLRSGSEYVSPWLHRLFEGHHADSAWAAVRDALPDDSLADELVGFVRGLGSDFVTRVGLPVVEITPDQYGQLRALVCDMLHVPQAWLIDALHFNAIEAAQFAAGCVPLVAAAMGWSFADSATFARLAGRLGIGAIAAANPMMILIALWMLAKAYESVRTGGDLGRAFAGGSLDAMAVLSVSALIGGPALLGAVGGVVLATGIRKVISDPRAEGWVVQSAEKAKSLFVSLVMPKEAMAT
jgi:hypothetical protein